MHALTGLAKAQPLLGGFLALNEAFVEPLAEVFLALGLLLKPSRTSH
ncbi:hypothetical protein [Leisingera daeponensis]|nr:hypothetical protein [Leisingera daeponensis]MBY6058716.1 hypothetical protein [Leisingera daeponensis]